MHVCLRWAMTWVHWRKWAEYACHRHSCHGPQWWDWKSRKPSHWVEFFSGDWWFQQSGECGGDLPLGEFSALLVQKGRRFRTLEVPWTFWILLQRIIYPVTIGWLDSGASCCVINKKSLDSFCHSELIGTGDDRATLGWWLFALVGGSD